MARTDAPPFERGFTFYNGATITADASTGLFGGYEHEGKVWVFEDVNWLQSGVVGAKTNRTSRMVHCMAIRNVSGINLLPGRVGALQTGGTDGRYFLGRCDGYGTTTAQRGCFVIDEWLPAAGVPNNDLFWGVIQGPTTVLTALDGGADNVYTVGLEFVALTAVTSQATTAGRIAPQDLTGAAALLGNQVQNKLGYALSAATTANTNLSLLVDITTPWVGNA